jgi:aminomethyltransferase
MGYCLYGNDIDETTNPLEAGLGWTVRLEKPGFIGKEALVEKQRAGFARKLVGLEIDGARIARQGSEVEAQGEPVGTVTSGSMGISLGKPVAMAYTRHDVAGVGTKLEVRTRGQATAATVVGKPMYKGGSVRAPKPRRAT